MIKVLGGILIGLVLMAMLSAVTAQAAREVEVRCYANHQNVGTLTIFTVSMAATSCNNVFNICEGNCTGCYMNIDGKEACIDSQGQAYYD